jgi:hypothetical protein
VFQKLNQQTIFAALKEYPEGIMSKGERVRNSSPSSNEIPEEINASTMHHRIKLWRHKSLQ